ncbi:hypothetical protein EOM81_10220 [bacterium]|nr:hypothetical protein [bacterium]
MNSKTYSGLSQLKSFEDRFDYLKMGGAVGISTFGFDRIFNQKFYSSAEWKRVRDYVIVRDNGCDLGIDGYEIFKGVKIFIHHMNPISLEDIDKRADILLNPEFLITTAFETHNAIHYGDKNLLSKAPIERARNDTCPWRG